MEKFFSFIKYLTILVLKITGLFLAFTITIYIIGITYGTIAEYYETVEFPNGTRLFTKEWNLNDQMIRMKDKNGNLIVDGDIYLVSWNDDCVTGKRHRPNYKGIDEFIYCKDWSIPEFYYTKYPEYAERIKQLHLTFKDLPEGQDGRRFHELVEDYKYQREWYE